MNKNLTKTLLSFSAILALSGCGSSSDYKASDNTGTGGNTTVPDAYEDKGGLSGIVVSNTYVKDATVCFDSNTNGLCDANEAKEKTFEGGKFSFTKEVSDLNEDVVLLAQVKDANGDYVLSSSISTTLISKAIGDTSRVISPFTTLVVNEQLFNPNVEGNRVKAIDYLEANITGLSREIYEGKDYVKDDETATINSALELKNSLLTSYKLKATNPFETIANTVDEVVKNDSLNVSVTNINNQERLDKSFDLKDLNQVTSWTKKYTDEIVMGSSASSSKVVSYSKWHNKLAILDTSDTSKAPELLDNNYYLEVDGGRHAVDATSGASEQEFAKVELSSSSDEIYSMITKYEKNSKDIGVGIYSGTLSNTVPAFKYASLSTGNSKYFNYPNIQDIKLSRDNTKLLASGDDKKILIFDASDLSAPLTTINSEDRVKTIESSIDNAHVFAGLSDRSENFFAIYDSTSGALVSKFLTDSYVSSIAVKNDNEVYVSLEESNKIIKLDISDKTDIKEVSTFTTSSNIKNLKLTSNNKYLIASLNLKQVNVFDLEKTSKVAIATMSENVNNAFEIAENKVAVTYGSSIKYFDIIDGIASLSDAQKQAWYNTHRKKN